MSTAHTRIEKLSIHLQTTSSREEFARNTSQDNESGPRSLVLERQQSTFVLEEMIHFLDGGKDMTKMKEEIMQELEDSKELNRTTYDLSHNELRKTTLRKVRKIYGLFLKTAGDLPRRNARLDLYSLYDMSWYIRNGVHFGLFMGAIMGQASSQQQHEWLPPTLNMEIYGCFAMTELGHGSFVRGLETTATFDRETDEFVINTPTDTATKWWIGAAGQTATHCILYAQLIIDGEKKGVHNFMIPLRDLETHKPCAGIHIGDCGPKMGLNGIDNGWIQFDHVRIPRSNMLSKYAHVLPSGEYSTMAKPQMAYGALISSRADLVMLACNMIKKALTISIRYSAIRRQGGIKLSSSKTKELQLLDYQMHQYRLMPLLATAYAFHFQVTAVRKTMAEYDDQIKHNTASDATLGLLADIHATMAGLKAFSTWTTQRAIEECRQCCGGHGYSLYNALASLVCDFAVMVTWEGDNTVMALQSARYLVQCAEKVAQGQPIAGSVAYLATMSHQSRKWKAQVEQDLLDSQLQLEALQFHAGERVYMVARKLEEEQRKGFDADSAWNNCQADLIHATRVHVNFTVARHFIQHIDHLDRQSSIAPVLKDLCDLFVLHQIQQDMQFYLMHDYISKELASQIEPLVQKLCTKVRRNAVSLVDAFNFSDRVLNSCIGRNDGDIYTHYLQAVKQHQGIAPYYNADIRPMFQGEWMIEEESENVSA